ncbi:MAG: amidohydrolase family protein [Acidobacteria bacterium]|nr:amidohydrolase family protein [Acidobacteriota bacterium]
MIKKIIHRAKYILPDPYTFLKNGAIEITEDGRIASIAPWRELSGPAGNGAVDWGAAIIMPGLVNAHVHMELTSLHNCLPQFHSFTDWLSQLIAKRQAWNLEHFRSSIREGIAQSLAAGTTTVGDVSSSGISRDLTSDSPLRKVIFEESIAFSPDLAVEKIADINRTLDNSKSGDLYEPGVSPHAPYTVSGDLYRGLAELARRRRLPLATHTAETEEEIQFLRNGTGEFRNFLNAMGLIPPGWKAPGLDPIPYLHSLGVLGTNCLLIHCNYLDRDSIKLVAGSHSSIVYCPRSHAFFRHRRHPIRDLLDAGINVALGTDSLASNKTLSMLDELRFLYKERKDLKSEEIMQAATLNGAKALGFGNRLGTLKSGNLADMTILEVPPDMGISNAPDRILEGAGECIGTIVGGRISWQKSDQPPVGNGLCPAKLNAKPD